jgi:hypothetical protein
MTSQMPNIVSAFVFPLFVNKIRDRRKASDMDAM